MVAVLQKDNLETFELSQTYPFLDKFELTSLILEQIIETSRKDIDRHIVQQLLADLMGDGGQIIVEGYKPELLKEVLTALTLGLGPPPSSTSHSVGNTWIKVEGLEICSRRQRIRPLWDGYSSQFEHFGLKDPACSQSSPQANVTSAGTWSTGQHRGWHKVEYVNVDMDVLKSACVKMNQVGMPIFFRCDIGQFTDKNLGMVDSDPFEYQIAINAIMLRMNKADRIMAGESVMTHAMVLKAVHLDEAVGRPVRCRFRKSWDQLLVVMVGF
ncbi:hypothetical protein MY1884_009430 [Beauveria asiatica]